MNPQKETVRTVSMVNTTPRKNGFKQKMRASGYSEAEIIAVNEYLNQRTGTPHERRKSRHIDLIEVVPCRCGELISTCYICELNRLRELNLEQDCNDYK